MKYLSIFIFLLIPGLPKSAYATHNFLCGKVFLMSGWRSGILFSEAVC